jgi:hypothetical protein
MTSGLLLRAYVMLAAANQPVVSLVSMLTNVSTALASCLLHLQY